VAADGANVSFDDRKSEPHEHSSPSNLSASPRRLACAGAALLIRKTKRLSLRRVPQIPPWLEKRGLVLLPVY
jgi:hypothetical protein